MKKIERSDIITHDVVLEIEKSTKIIELYNTMKAVGMTDDMLPYSFKQLYDEAILKMLQDERINKLNKINESNEE